MDPDDTVQDFGLHVNVANFIDFIYPDDIVSDLGLRMNVVHVLEYLNESRCVL